MGNEILDHDEDAVNTTSIYADRSAKFFLIAFALVILLFVLVHFNLRSNGNYLTFSFIVVTTIFVCSIIGFVNGILSFVKKENEKVKMMIGIVGNLLIILFIFYAVYTFLILSS